MLLHEPDFSKREWSGFHRTQVDYHLRGYNIKTLIAVGFSQRTCLYQMLAGAVDKTLPGKGSLQKIMLRNFEHIIWLYILFDRIYSFLSINPRMI